LRGRVAGLEDLHLCSIWRYDGLDVLVVDRHALQSVDFLDLVTRKSARASIPRIRRMFVRNRDCR